MKKTLKEQLKRYEGQPIRLFTDDGRKFKGIELSVDDDCVTCIDKCGRLFTFKLCHIDAVEEPQLALHNCRKWKDGDLEPAAAESDCGCGDGCCTRSGCC